MSDFNKYWRNRLGGEQSPQGDFFEPSDRVWSNIQSAIHERRIIPWLPILLSLGIVVMGLLWWSAERQNGRLEKAVSASNSALKASESNYDKLADQFEEAMAEMAALNNLLDGKDGSIGGANGVIAQESTSTAGLQYKTKTAYRKPNNLLTSLEASLNERQPATQDSELKMITAEDFAGVGYIGKTNNDVNRLGLIGLSKFNVSQTYVVSPVQMAVHLNNDKMAMRPWKVGARAELNSTATVLDGTSELFDAVSSGDKRANGYGVGVRISRYVHGNFYVESGLDFDVLNYISTYALSIPYTHGTESWANESTMENSFTHSLPSSMGMLRTNISVQRDVDDYVNEGEMIDLDFHVTQRIETLSLPLILGYELGWRKWSLGAGAGVAMNYVTHHDVTASEVHSHHYSIQPHLSAADLINHESALSFSWIGRVGLSYQLPHGLSLTSNVGMRQNINPIYKKSGITTRFKNRFVSLGVNKSF